MISRNHSPKTCAVVVHCDMGTVIITYDHNDATVDSAVDCGSGDDYDDDDLFKLYLQVHVGL